MRLGFILIFISVFVKGFGQFDFERLNTIDGLSQNDVIFIYQDSKGFMWFGTYDGLNRYDGRTFKVYRKTSEMDFPIGSNLPFCIAEDLDGDLWVGTSDAGVWYFDRKKQEFHGLPVSGDDGVIFPDPQISSLCINSNGLLFVSTATGLSIFDAESFKHGQIKGFFVSDSLINSSEYSSDILRNGNKLFPGPDNSVLFGTSKGLFRISVLEDFQIKITRFFKKPLNSSCWDIVKTKRGYVASFSAGLFYLSDRNIPKGETVIIDKSPFFELEYTHGGDIWAGNSQGLYQFRFDENQLKLKLLQHFQHQFNNDKSLSKNNVVSIFEDRTGLLWIGTNGGGINKLDLNKKKFFHVYQTNNPGSLSHDKVRALHEDRLGNLWVGTEGGGISFLPQNSQNYFKDFQRIDITSSKFGQNYVYCFLDVPGFENKIIFGAGYPHKLGVCTIEKNGNIKIVYYDNIVSGPVFSMTSDFSGNIWAGTYGSGLYQLKYDTIENKLVVLKNYRKSDDSGLSSNIVRSVLEDHLGNIWIGTDNGLNMLPISERRNEKPIFKVFHFDAENDSSLSHDYILPLFLDSRNIVWVGTMGGGLCKVNRNKLGQIWFTRFNSKNGFPNDVIKAIEEDAEGNLWLSSNRGLTKFNPLDGEIRNYSVADGLQDYEFSELASFRRKTGQFLFGGVNGFNTFYPSQIIDNPFVSRTEFTELFILNKHIQPGKKYNGRVILKYEMPYTDSIKLKYSENSFSIIFSALHYYAPKKIKYKYFLEGFDEQWTEISGNEPKANYTNIPPGEYVLKVMATNNDGIWNPVSSSLYIKIIPPWWQTSWAFLLYIILFVVMLLFFRKYSIIAVTQKNQLLMEHFQQQKMAELLQLKLQFFTNISHEFRTPLTLIKTPIEMLLEKNKHLSIEEREKTYSIILKNIDILNKLINQILDFRKLEAGKMPLSVSKYNIVDLVKSVYESFSEMAKQKNIQFRIGCSDSYIELWFDYDKIEKVLFNLLSNAFKYTSSGGEVAISVNEVIKGHKEWVQIDVQDNGIGIEAERLPYIFERFYQDKKINLSGNAGTGIGLAFAKSLIDLHKGEINVVSQPNVRTVFSVFLKKGKLHFTEEDLSDFPSKEENNHQPVLTEQNAIESLVSPQNKDKIIDPNKPSVLIVEDNIDVQNLLYNCLSEKYNVIQGFNGQEGLSLCREFYPDIIISDVMMPEMDGYKMCQEIKNDAEICHIPIIILTAKTTEEERFTGLTHGAEAYISKPFNIKVLKAQIESLLKARKLVKEQFSKKINIEPHEVTFTSVDEKLLDRLLKIVEKNISNPEFTVVQLAEEAGMGQAVLNKKLKALLGQTAKAFIRTIRLKRAAQLLKLGRLSVSDVVYEVGFNDMKYFRECFRKQFNLTPSEYIRKYKSESDANSKED